MPMPKPMKMQHWFGFIRRQILSQWDIGKESDNEKTRLPQSRIQFGTTKTQARVDEQFLKNFQSKPQHLGHLGQTGSNVKPFLQSKFFFLYQLVYRQSINDFFLLFLFIQRKWNSGKSKFLFREFGSLYKEYEWCYFSGPAQYIRNFRIKQNFIFKCPE